MTQISNTISENINTSKIFNLAKLDIINKWIAIILAFMIPISTAGTNITALIILILFLASESASYITGQTILIDGGVSKNI